MLQSCILRHLEPDMNTTSDALWACADVVSLIHRVARTLFTDTFFSLLNFFWLSIFLFLTFLSVWASCPFPLTSLLCSSPLIRQSVRQSAEKKKKKSLIKFTALETYPLSSLSHLKSSLWPFATLSIMFLSLFSLLIQFHLLPSPSSLNLSLSSSPLLCVSPSLFNSPSHSHSRQ